MKKLIHLLGILLLMIPLVSPQEETSEPLLALKAARLIDGTGGPVIEDPVVLIRGEKIELVGTRDQVKIPANAEVLQLDGQTLLPGFVDTQASLTVRPDPTGLAGIIEKVEEDLRGRDMTLATRHVRTALVSGVTTLRVAGDAGYTDVYLAEAIQNGTVIGPRIFASGPALTSSGVPAPRSWKVDGPLELRKFIRNNLHRGAQTMKLQLFDVSVKGSNFTDEELASIVDELQRNGRVISADVKGLWGSSLKSALQAGITLIEDPFPLNEEFFPLFLQSGAAISVNEISRYLYFDDDLWRFFDREVKSLQDWWRRMEQIIDKIDAMEEPDAEWSDFLKQQFYIVKDREQRQEVLRLARESGIPVTVGTGYAYGGIAHQLEYLVEAGWTPAEAIASATGEAAKILGLEQYVGTVAEGKFADLIAVPGNPLESLDQLRAISLVIKGGQQFDTKLSIK